MPDHVDEHARKLQIVDGMLQARQRGHNRVAAFLEHEGVARLTAYRWKQELEWWLLDGLEEVARGSVGSSTSGRRPSSAWRRP